jgi:hypothetical protein
MEYFYTFLHWVNIQLLNKKCPLLSGYQHSLMKGFLLFGA